MIKIKTRLSRIATVVALCAAVPLHAQERLPFEVDGAWGFKDLDGRVVVEPKFEGVGCFLGGLAAAKFEGRFGFIDPAGDFVISPDYEQVAWFSEGLAPVRREDGSWFYLNSPGEDGGPTGTFDMALPFSMGVAPVVVDGTYKYIDEEGNDLFGDLELEEARPFANGFAGVQINSKYGFIDLQGNIVGAINYDDVGDFSEGLAPVKRGNKWGYVGSEGNVEHDFEFAMAGAFRQGRALVSTENGMYLLGMDGSLGAVAGGHGTVDYTIESSPSAAAIYLIPLLEVNRLRATGGSFFQAQFRYGATPLEVPLFDQKYILLALLDGQDLRCLFLDVFLQQPRTIRIPF